jgi:hypothetical protein
VPVGERLWYQHRPSRMNPTRLELTRTMDSIEVSSFKK